MCTHRKLNVALLLLFAAGCDRSRTNRAGQVPVENATTQPVSTTQPAPRNADRIDVIEAVFRHQFNKNASGGQRHVDYFFLSLADHTDPPAELLARFKDEKPIVLPVSMAAAPAADGIRHKQLGGRGLIFRVTSIALLDENTAVVEGGYYEGMLSASGNTYRVKRMNGSWTVIGNQMNWIS